MLVSYFAAASIYPSSTRGLKVASDYKKRSEKGKESKGKESAKG